MKLSIIIPAHNESKTIVKCLNSIFTQKADKSKYEVIVVDDFSEDKTSEVVLSNFGGFPNLKVIRTSININCGPARNLGYQNSSGEYIWCIDADDDIYPDCLDKIIEKLEKTNVDCLYLNYISNEKKKCILQIDSLQKLCNTAIGPWCRTYKRQFYINFPNYRPEDVYPFYLMVDQVKTVDYMPIYCYHWNIYNPMSMTRAFDFCNAHPDTLLEYAKQNYLINNNLSDKWVSGIIRNLADMYDIRNKLKTPCVRDAWSRKFYNEWYNCFVRNKFVH